ncbi:MAG TPA: hypothetical protein VKT32_12885 [Chthonomonadaceae bacterium]|nr:hypothetical protein [Chthonomonadaceae bacterium]
MKLTKATACYTAILAALGLATAGQAQTDHPAHFFSHHKAHFFSHHKAHFFPHTGPSPDEDYENRRTYYHRSRYNDADYDESQGNGKPHFFSHHKAHFFSHHKAHFFPHTGPSPEGE